MHRVYKKYIVHKSCSARWLRMQTQVWISQDTSRKRIQSHSAGVRLLTEYKKGCKWLIGVKTYSTAMEMESIEMHHS